MPSELNIPDLLRSTRGRDDQGRAWLASLPAQLADRLDAWELRRTGPAVSGYGALVVPVERADGSPAVLKFQPVDEENAGEAVALRLWDGDGAVRLLADHPATGALLLEGLDASRPLAAVPGEDEMLDVIIGLLGRLTARPAPPGIRRLADIAEAMLAYVPEALPHLADPGDRALLDACAWHVRQLLPEAGGRLLLWDLHDENVLAPLPGSGREPWLAIDPKPIAGDLGFDLHPAIRNRWDAAVASGDPAKTVLRRFDRMVDGLALDRDRAVGWTLGRVLQDALWDVEDGENRLSDEQRVIGRALLGA